jgi:transcriptional regulator GlxA family with amidase domain
MESKIEGLNYGADDYISKPFEAIELKVRVKNLIDLRRKLRERFQKELKINPTEVTANSLNEKLLEKICNIVEQHMDDVKFTPEKLAIDSNMSHRNLNRKLNALTDHSAREFISTMRLKRAAQLLQSNSDTVTQIAFQVGFSSMSHFTKIFRQQFSTTPSQYRSQFKKSS